MRFALRSTGFAPLLGGGLLTALFAVSGPALMPASGKTGQQAARETTVLESAIASKLHQLARLKRDIDEGGCEFAADDASIEACQQLEARVRSLEAEIEELTGPRRPYSEVRTALYRAAGRAVRLASSQTL
jgi:TolA-binding protein